MSSRWRSDSPDRSGARRGDNGPGEIGGDIAVCRHADGGVIALPTDLARERNITQACGDGTWIRAYNNIAKLEDHR